VSTFQQRSRLRETSPEEPQRNTRSARIRLGTWWTSPGAADVRPVLMSLALVLLTTIGLFVIGDLVRPSAIPLIYMLPVVLAATQWGRVAGLVAAFTCAAAADFFFYPPYYSFLFDSPQDVVDLLLYLLVSVITSNLAARLKNEAATSSRRASAIADLHAFSQGLATCLTSRDLILAVQDYLSNTLGFRTVLLAATPDEHGDAESTAVPDQITREAAKMIAANARPGSIIIEPLIHRAWLIKTIVPEILGYGAIAIELGNGSEVVIEAVGKKVEAMIEEATITLKYLKTKEAIEQATINYKTEILRDALIGGISHELRSPLASILGSCSVLNKMPVVQRDCDSHALIEAIHDQAAQLDNSIRDLLDASRISANGVQPQLMWTDPTDIVAAAVKQKERRLAAHQVVLDFQRDAPFVHVDTVLVEQALGQLLENAAKYSPAGTEIKVSSRCGVGYLEMSVTDHGSGLTAEEKSALGKHCYRGERHGAASGSGLGLWIASTFIAANRGTLFAESQGPNRGTTMTVRLPTVSEDTPKFRGGSND
jgi:K+-sensing histidine kinase KdpD